MGHNDIGSPFVPILTIDLFLSKDEGRAFQGPEEIEPAVGVHREVVGILVPPDHVSQMLEGVLDRDILEKRFGDLATACPRLIMINPQHVEVSRKLPPGWPSEM